MGFSNAIRKVKRLIRESWPGEISFDSRLVPIPVGRDELSVQSGDELLSLTARLADASRNEARRVRGIVYLRVAEELELSHRLRLAISVVPAGAEALE